MIREIPDAALDIVAKFEGCELTAYRDIVGVLTVGYGSTGPHVKPGMKITKAEARNLLRADMKIAAQRIHAKIPGVVGELTDNQYAALLSFVFNLGSGNPAKPEWTIWKRLRAKQFDQIPLEFMKFVNAGGKKVKGLVNRRTAEVQLWSTDEPGSTEESLPSSVTREVVTPPTPADPTPIHKSGQLITVAATAVAGVPVAVQQVAAAVEPYAQQNVLIQQVLGTLAVVAAVAAVIGLVLAWLNKKKNQS